MRHGFTLFEVGVSLMIMTIAVTTVLMVLPTGIRLQQTARYQFLAAAKAQSLVANMSSRTQLTWTSDWLEGRTLVDGVHVNAGPRRPDFHQIANNFIDGMGAVMPPELARRLDSAGDEIQRILDEGGDIYYIPPFAVNSLDHSSAGGGTEHSDAAMRRIIYGFRGYAQENALNSHPQTAWPYPNAQPGRGANWERNLWDEGGITRPNPDDYTETGMRLTTLGLPLPLPELVPDAPAIAAFYDTLTDVRFPAACLALRNHAYASLRRATLSNNAAEIDQARHDHEWMMCFLMWARSALPDDHRIPRLSWNQVMTDIPLLQYDLFASAAVVSAAGDYPARRSNAAEALWRTYPLISERPMRFARSWTYAEDDDATPVTPNASSGRFNLTAPFRAAERSRQLVVWVVDWQSYEDAESLPAAPVDPARLTWRPHFPHSFDAALSKRQHPHYGMRLVPEWIWLFRSAARTQTYGLDYSDVSAFHQANNAPMSVLGRFGVDRNGNGVHDIGPTRTSVRLRATTVARFNLYDPRGHVILR